jgi:hypothetical protein
MQRQHCEQAAFLGTAQPDSAVGSDHLDRAEKAQQRGRHRTTFAAAVRGVHMPPFFPTLAAPYWPRLLEWRTRGS